MEAFYKEFKSETYIKCSFLISKVSKVQISEEVKKFCHLINF